MPYSHPLDRLAAKLRPLIFVMLALSVPVMLTTYGLMLKHAFLTWPWWGIALTVVSHLSGWLGISALFDSRQERMTQR